jgi:metallo-beta-lactamase class B
MSKIKLGAVLLTLVAVAMACTNLGAKNPPPSRAIPLSEQVYVEEIGPGIWRHVSRTFHPGFGFFPSNGLIVATRTGSLLIDTAPTPEQTKLLIEWAEAWVGPVQGLIVGHFHEDRMGGIEATIKAGIPSFAIEETANKAAAEGLPPIDEVIPSGFSLEALGIAGEVFFPGAGHTLDNSVVWLSDAKLIHGGCLVKSASSTSIGNIRDADIAAWPASIATLGARYPDAEIVVPGHGPVGDFTLLDTTLTLLNAHLASER